MTNTTARIRITGAPAADIARHVRTYVRPGFNWQEVQAMDECRHGCKLHVRKRGAVTQYALLHNGAYGCQQGRSEATHVVPVSIAPRAAV
jgi:hypothetical protein